MINFSRIFYGLARFSRCGEKLGWKAAFQVYILARALGCPVVVRLREVAVDFHLRGGAADLGSFASFYLGYPVIGGVEVRTVLDGGANIGDSAVLFAWKYSPELVVAVEPDKENFELLVKNTAAVPCVAPVCCALWSHDSTVSLIASEGSTVASSVRVAGPGDKVEARSIVSLARQYKLEGFDLVKLDIEGAEREVLGVNPSAWLKHCRILILELHDQISPGAGLAMIEAVRESGPFNIRNIGEYLVFVRCEKWDCND